MFVEYLNDPGLSNLSTLWILFFIIYPPMFCFSSGFETPPTPKSEISSHESYKEPPQKPCVCHPPFYYNRYAKVCWQILCTSRLNISCDRKMFADEKVRQRDIRMRGVSLLRKRLTIRADVRPDIHNLPRTVTR